MDQTLNWTVTGSSDMDWFAYGFGFGRKNRTFGFFRIPGFSKNVVIVLVYISSPRASICNLEIAFFGEFFFLI